MVAFMLCKGTFGSQTEYSVGLEIITGFCRNSTEPVEEFWKNGSKHW